MNQSRQTVEPLSFAQILALPSTEKEARGLLHTPQEIHQQPSTWLETFQILKSRQRDLQEFLRESGLGGVCNERVGVCLIGAGTSDHIGSSLTALLKNEWKCHVEAIPSTDLLTEMDEFIASAPASTRHLWISFSRSGDSFEGVTVIQNALEKYPLIRHLIVTCNKNSRMANEIARDKSNVFCLALDEKVNDLGLAMTGSFTNMVVAGHCLAHIFDLDEYQPILEALSQVGAERLPEIAELAEKTASIDYSRICFLGSGALKSVAKESALKVMELTAGHYSVMGESFLGLRHGPLSWLNHDSLVIGFLSNYADKLRIELGLLEELNKKGAAKNILAVMPQEDVNVSEYVDYKLILDIPEWLDDLYRPPVDVLFAQCLGLFASLRRRLKPDAPSADGKIQRVVSQIGFAG
ncbi:MAG: SIS domain-containing protein [Acidobacteriota bacterium]|nr:SIS domain-containing protein [Acidobacteriota bacterium]